MKRRIINTVVALMAMATAGNAQQLSVGTIEAVAGKQTEITVSLTGATGKTALQYNLSLPAGLTLAETTGDYGIKLGNATKGHTLSVSPLASGDLLIVLYSMYQDTFADGTLMTIPVVASSENGTTSGSLNTIRTATADAVSSKCADVAFSATATAGNAQQLSVGTIEAVAGKQTEITVSLTGATGKTALQYNLSLPAGLTLAETTGDYGIKLGNATKGHTLSVSPLASGDLLIVLYSMYQDTFADGTLMTIPVVASSENGTTSGSLNTIRTATADAVSSKCADVAFGATVTGINGVEAETSIKNKGVYSISGVKVGDSVEGLTKGIYIVNGKKIVVKQ